MTDWIVSKLPSGKVEVTSSNRAIPKQEFFERTNDPATIRAFDFIAGEFEWGDRILTQEVKW
jgi:hypothetical protein